MLTFVYIVHSIHIGLSRFVFMSLVKCYIYQIFMVPNSGKKDGARKVAQLCDFTVGVGIIFVGKVMVGFFNLLIM